MNRTDSNNPSVDFLHQLEQEARLQSQLEQKKILPQRLRGVARLLAAFPWQVLLVLSGLTALVASWWS